MDPVNLVLQGGIFLVQSVLCVLYACRTNDKLADIENNLIDTRKQFSLRLNRLEKLQVNPQTNQYHPPPAYISPSPYLPPSPYAPPQSFPKSYEP